MGTPSGAERRPLVRLGKDEWVWSLLGRGDGASGSALSIGVKQAAGGFSGPLSPPHPVPGVPNPVEKGLAGPVATPPGIGKRRRFYQ